MTVHLIKLAVGIDSFSHLMERQRQRVADAAVRGDKPTGANVESAAAVGKAIAERATAAGISEVIFDRGGCRYHGRVKALAEAAREGGLKF